MSKILKLYLNANPFWMFLPFLILFIVIILKLGTNTLQGDEGRYYQFAQNLLMGFYSTPAPEINLWNGPGYPLFLTPFIFFKLPLITIKLTNAFLQYLSIVLIFLSINNYITRKFALILSFGWAFYYISYQELPLMLTEPLTSFLSSLIIFLLVKIKKTENSKVKFSILTGIVIGFLALTKIIFGYVIISVGSIFLIYYIFGNNKTNRKIGLLIFISAFVVNIPYLIYTYNLTGKFLYWGNSGGSSLYWMSTPIEGEFGEWNNSTFTANCGNDLKIPCNSDLFAKNHQRNFDYIAQLPIISQDEELKKIAFNNIINNPVKYIRNCISNLSRLFFGVPNSYFYQREQTFWRILPNSIMFYMLIFCSIMTIINRRIIEFEIAIVTGIIVFYLFFSLLVSAYPRHFYVIVPLLFFWFSFVFSRTIELKIKIAS